MGSEMCIRDRGRAERLAVGSAAITAGAGLARRQADGPFPVLQENLMKQAAKERGEEMPARRRGWVSPRRAPSISSSLRVLLGCSARRRLSRAEPAVPSLFS